MHPKCRVILMIEHVQEILMLRKSYCCHRKPQIKANRVLATTRSVLVDHLILSILMITNWGWRWIAVSWGGNTTETSSSGNAQSSNSSHTTFKLTVGERDTGDRAGSPGNSLCSCCLRPAYYLDHGTRRANIWVVHLTFLQEKLTIYIYIYIF